MKITGPTTEYTAALLDDSDPLNGLIKLLSAFDVKFKGSQFTYKPQDQSVVLVALPLASALAIEPVATPRGFEIKGYPWSVKISATAMVTAIPDDVAAWFPNSSTTDEETETVLRNTFGEAVAAMTNYNTHKSLTDDETVIANLGNLYSIDKAGDLHAVDGIDVITLDEFNAFVAANGDEE